MNSPREHYRQRVTARTEIVAAAQRQHVLLGYLRLALVIIGALAAWFSFHRAEISRWWVLAVFAVFVVIARRHSAVLQHKAEAQRAIRFFERGIARIEDRWADLPGSSPARDTPKSLFADDLDLFCRGGLFELLSTDRTSAGDDALASWLLEPAEPKLILSRQDAIAELREIHELREDLAACGHADFEKLEVDALAAWGTQNSPSIPQWTRWLAPALVVLTIAAAVLYLAWNRGWPLLILVLVEAQITFFFKKRALATFVEAEKASDSLRLASILIEKWEGRQFNSPLLVELQARFASRDRSASHALTQLALLTQMMAQHGNLMVRIFDVPLLYSVQLAGAAQSWRRKHGAALQQWLRALGDLEALQSLATYSFEHPGDPFPEILDTEPHFEAEGLGHPLIAEAKCVRNDVALGRDARLLLVSGSNMSGKSTLLRAVGINAVLAMAGAPVRATSLRMTPLHIGASIQVNDSLQEGRSRFYSEILRLRAICELAEQQPPALFLLDELLDGTNSSDRLTGATGIAHALLASGAIGMISTHDLALTEIAGDNLALRNVHFEERLEDNEMQFDFRLRDGVVTTRNGVALMRMVGLKV